MKNKTGKWIVREIRARWFCRNCWQKGIAVIRPSIAAGSVDDAIRMIENDLHTNCKQPEIRFTEVGQKGK